MCAIVGYSGYRTTIDVLADMLARLEYRGYDSAGLAIVDNHKLRVRKVVGKIQDLQNSIERKPFPPSDAGIGHTRWATHGPPTRVNAHPHLGPDRVVAVVHNGIIENYSTLRRNLKRRGHVFKSETDTEVIAHLVEEYYEGDMVKAISMASRKMRGGYAFCVICSDHPDVIWGTARGNPLVAGIGTRENFISSDIPSMLTYTRKVVPIPDGDIVRITGGNMVFYNNRLKIHDRPVMEITSEIEVAEKNGYPHFMLKEIFEQPDVIVSTLARRVHGQRISLDGIGLAEKSLKRIKRVMIIGCGTAWHAGLVGRHMIEQAASIAVDVELASEFRYRKTILDRETLAVAITQSGETADTLAAIREASSQGLKKIISINNTVGSSIARQCRGNLYTYAGLEIGVASTKAYTSQLINLALLAIELGRIHGTLNPAEIKTMLTDLRKVPGWMRTILARTSDIENIATKYAKHENFIYLGRNLNYPSALEGALKLKEISYIHAEGYPAGEMKHGPIALIDRNMPVVMIAVQSSLYDKIISNMQEVSARGAKVIAIASESDGNIESEADDVLRIPDCPEWLSPLVVAVPLQLMSYAIAVRRGCDVDQPRNLAKSVTVE